MIGHCNFSNDASVQPLAVIREKERALEQEIRAAQGRANACVAEARARADEIKAQAEQDGVCEAETSYQEGLARARTEAKTIEERGEANALRLYQAGRTKVQKAADYIVRFVLPKIENNETDVV